MTNRRLWIEYTGSWPNQCFHFDGQATQFWTLSDGRQVADARSRLAYRWLLENEENIVPFVPRGEEDWIEVTELVTTEDRRQEIISLGEDVEQKRAAVHRHDSKAAALMTEADELELRSQKLRAEVEEMEEDYVKLKAEVKEAETRLKKITDPPKPKPKPAARKPASTKKKKE